MRWTYATKVLRGEEIVETFQEKELQIKNQIEFRIEISIQKEVYKLYLKGESCDNSYNSLIDKNDIVILNF